MLRRFLVVVDDRFLLRWLENRDGSRCDDFDLFLDGGRRSGKGLEADGQSERGLGLFDQRGSLGFHCERAANEKGQNGRVTRATSRRAREIATHCAAVAE